MPATTRFITIDGFGSAFIFTGDCLSYITLAGESSQTLMRARANITLPFEEWQGETGKLQAKHLLGFGSPISYTISLFILICIRSNHTRK